VYRWEVDNVDHFTVAFYFARFEDAARAMLRALGLGGPTLAAAGRRTVNESFHVRYVRELRVGDVMHVRSGVIDALPDGIVLGHQMLDSGDGALCTTVEQRVRLVDAATGSPALVGAEAAAGTTARRIGWDVAERWSPGGLPMADDGLIDSSRDCIGRTEVDADGRATLPAYIHRFSAANGHVLAAFGMTPAYMREEHRGLSTFEFRLRFFGELHAGEPALVRSGVTHKIGRAHV